MNEPHLLPLPGLDGANPLGFLAAIGTWRIADQIQPGTKLHWSIISNHWAPTLTFPVKIGTLSILLQLSRKLRMKPTILLSFEKNLNIEPDDFRSAAQKAFAEQLGLEALGWLSSIGSDAVSEIHQGKTKRHIKVSKFRLLSGSGRQDFIPTIQAILNSTTLRQCVDSLLRPWPYEDEKMGLRWDPLEQKQYALRWKDPSPDPTRTQRGANRLAIEALPLLPTFPAGNRLETTGFSGHRSNDTCWTWPIWECPITLDTARSLLALRDIQQPSPDPAELRPRGIVAVFRSQRITTGKFRNFTPAVQVI
jgi:hypothetical protein